MMTQQIIDALVSKYQAQKMEALCNLNVYFTAGVGVGEHPNLVAECDKLISQVAEADGKIATLKAVVEESNKVNKEGEGSNNR